MYLASDYLITSTNKHSEKDSLHTELLRDLAKVAASPAVKEEDFHTTFLKALARSESKITKPCS